MPKIDAVEPPPRTSPSRPGAEHLLFVALLLGFLVIAAGGVLLNRTIARHLLERDAQDTAEAWAHSLTSMIGAELPSLLGRMPPSPSTEAALAKARQFGGAYRYKLFDARGDLVLSSDDLGGTRALSETLAGHSGNSALAAAVLGGARHVGTARGTPPASPAFYAEAYVPIVVAGAVVGAAEVYVDQTAKQAAYERAFLALQGIAAALVLLAAAPPAILAWHRSRERRAAEARVHFLAHHDSLTGLPNRERLHDALHQALARARRGGSHVGVIALDLDGFKEVNDTLGHAAGDALLRLVAERLSRSVRGEDTVARLGGDEFVVVQVGLPQPVGAAQLAERILRTLAEPYELDGHRALVGCSGGVAVGPADGETPDLLIARADAALYRAKQEGRGEAHFFEPGMDEALKARRAMEHDLRAAVADGGFTLDFQPLCNLPDGRLSGFEALLRWNRPGHGPVSPGEFIPLAEETGLIVQIGDWVLRTACKAATTWPEAVTVAVNLSPAQFRRGNLVGTVAAALSESGLAARRLELEVTEGLLLHDSDSVLATLDTLRGMGVGIAMDDFGTGYSSLAYLWRFPFSKLKIDRSFVSGVNENAKLVSIVEAVVSLGRSLGLAVTAEGVETEQEVAMLRRLGCDLGQGYLLGRPMDADQAQRLAQADHGPPEHGLPDQYMPDQYMSDHGVGVPSGTRRPTAPRRLGNSAQAA